MLESDGALPAYVRRAIARGDDPADLAPLLAKVRAHAYRIVDRDVEGLDTDVVLEAVLAAALARGRAAPPGSTEGDRVRLELHHDPEASEQIRELRERDGYVSDISLALRYRPDLFGRPFSELLQEVMKGPSEWTEAERELFAAFVSLREQCPF